MPLALYALAAGAFGIGVTEFVIMGLLLEVSRDLGVSLAAAGLLISGYALGVVVGAPVLTILTASWNRKQVLVGLMVIFIAGNAACALAPTYGLLMAARVLTALTHGTYFGVGSVLAGGLVGRDRQASAIAIMFTGLTLANILGVPAGTWLGQQFGWRATFWAVTAVGVAALAILVLLVPADRSKPAPSNWKSDLKAVSRAPVVLGFATTVLGFAGVFALFTYIAPLLTEIGGFADGAVSPILLVFGGGLVAGNLLGGRLADRRLKAAVIGSMAALAAVLVAMAVGMENRIAAVALTGLLGAAGFATVPPLQAFVLSKATGAGESLASSLNIAAFNLGNALGAWAGGIVISDGPGLAALPLAAAAFPALAIVVALAAMAFERRRAAAPDPIQSTAC
ncbi:MFS transporter [Rhodobium gokarnense]|uniref:DHA1 family inner membrane transport protein n=1 Tax=Rhodobium gokarnense TaxID=364296 RepID=A0ABT3HB71_9HYPH|nr:MFS transporter [Rhodobium gokarnense]MCW2307546.1 DHA1 family inner membrane transport protein [Rhodobium gokarnense]